MIPDLNGKWTGELVYGESFGQLEHEALFFIIELRQAADEFSGTYKDIEGVGTNPCVAVVKGFTDHAQIFFIKEYDTQDLEKQRDKLLVGEDKPGSEVSFSGVYDPATKEFTGDWIKPWLYTAFDKEFFGKGREGTWRMRRES